jgi:hypothetical protein
VSVCETETERERERERDRHRERRERQLLSDGELFAVSLLLEFNLDGWVRLRIYAIFV